jgi:hypothetical protein
VRCDPGCRSTAEQRPQAIGSGATCSNNVWNICRPANIDQAFVDFDGVRYHLHTPERKTNIVLSAYFPCWDELVGGPLTSVYCLGSVSLMHSGREHPR